MEERPNQGIIKCILADSGDTAWEIGDLNKEHGALGMQVKGIVVQHIYLKTDYSEQFFTTAGSQTSFFSITGSAC